jgi:predicted transposase/invertase (TIGR01784 family)
LLKQKSIKSKHLDFIELPKFRKENPDLSKPFDCWLLFIEDSPEEVRQMIADIDPVIAKAETLLEHLGSLEESRRYYELREKAIHDEITRITGAKAEGRNAEKLETARNMLTKGLALPLIIKITGLAEADITKLQMQLKDSIH